jgi:hypothetical protein
MLLMVVVLRVESDLPVRRTVCVSRGVKWLIDVGASLRLARSTFYGVDRRLNGGEPKLTERFLKNSRL